MKLLTSSMIYPGKYGSILGKIQYVEDADYQFYLNDTKFVIFRLSSSLTMMQKCWPPLDSASATCDQHQFQGKQNSGSLLPRICTLFQPCMLHILLINSHQDTYHQIVCVRTQSFLDINWEGMSLVHFCWNFVMFGLTWLGTGWKEFTSAFIAKGVIHFIIIFADPTNILIPECTLKNVRKW